MAELVGPKLDGGSCNLLLLRAEVGRGRELFTLCRRVPLFAGDRASKKKKEHWCQHICCFVLCLPTLSECIKGSTKLLVAASKTSSWSTRSVLPGFSDNKLPNSWTKNARFMISFNTFQNS